MFVALDAPLFVDVPVDSDVPLDSPLELLGMGLTAGTTLRLETAGPDETACADALAKLFQKTYDFR